ncbi:MAG TPA: tRNA (guanosine(37)-N1)-methyltransferase TrmD [Actinomycetota bacterium]|nr:tRNA (guanosine(37)-N1)-methyltransferase TrmD [Actinomycetota bacterium]
MRIDVLTIFPEAVEPFTQASLLGKAVERGLLEVHVHDLRDHTRDRHRKVDDQPYGGGPGMVMKAEPFFDALEALCGEPVSPIRAPEGPAPEGPAPEGDGPEGEGDGPEGAGRRPRVVLLSPSGARMDQAKVRELAQRPWLVLLCGRYEGVDERVAEHLADEELSIGDYVLAGGEAAAIVVVDAVARVLPGVAQDPESIARESFEEGLLDHPQYTRPPDFRGWTVPEVLLSGHHGEIERWRRAEAERRTRERRPDLLGN